MNIIAAIKDATSRHFGVSRFDIASPSVTPALHTPGR